MSAYWTPQTKFTSVFHVTKEYGKATFGGLGVVVTSLTKYQARFYGPSYEINVIMPYYSFIRKDEGRKGQITLVEIMSFNHPEYGKLMSKVFIVRDGRVNLYFISPAINHPEFSHAFESKDAFSLYEQNDYLDNDLKDIFFAKMTALFIEKRINEENNIALHLHGATNGLVLKFLEQLNTIKCLYTMHDYYYEVRYGNRISNLNGFLKAPFLNSCTGDFVPSAYAIEHSNIVSMVSKQAVKDIIEGKLSFEGEEVILEPLLKRIREKTFFGISNGVDLEYLSPSWNHKLYEERIQVTEKEDDGLMDKKKESKNFLLEKRIIRGSGHDIWALFIGRFQEAKGVKFLQKAAEMFNHLGVTFIIMGQENDYAISEIMQLQKYENVIIISDSSTQKSYGSMIRMAADIMFVPSLNEAFGLVAVEGLWFGSLIISTAVGGLKEFLIPASANQLASRLLWSGDCCKGEGQPYCFSFNSFIFNPVGSERSLEIAIENGVLFLKQLDKKGRGCFVRSLIESAKKMSWDAPDGGLWQYKLVYKMLINEF